MSEHVKGKSGNHPAILAYRQKMDSIAEGTMPVLEALNARLDRALERAHADDAADRAWADDRREPEDDERRESEIPIDVVEVPSQPLRPLARGADTDGLPPKTRSSAADGRRK